VTESDHPFISYLYWIIRKTSSLIVRPFWIKNIVGLKNIPRNGAAILAFNHQSFFDFICFAAISPRNIHYLAAEKFFYHPLTRLVMILTGQIKVNRNDHDKKGVHEMIEKHVKKGSLIGIFPEGTRSPHEKEMLKAFTGVAQFALKHKVPIIPIGIIGTYEVMAKHHKRPNFKKVVTINIGEPLHFHEHHGKYTDRLICTEVTEGVMSEIEKLSGKYYPHYELRKI
jgi:1-acyl-sn-glycerol-3-phosphate acyltransferase